jgi:hypothetical protein
MQAPHENYPSSYGNQGYCGQYPTYSSAYPTTQVYPSFAQGSPQSHQPVMYTQVSPYPNPNPNPQYTTNAPSLHQVQPTSYGPSAQQVQNQCEYNGRQIEIVAASPGTENGNEGSTFTRENLIKYKRHIGVGVFLLIVLFIYVPTNFL